MIPINRNLDPLERSGIRVFTNLAKATPDCRMLTIGEPDLPTPEPVKQAAFRSLSRDETHYAPNQGTASLRAAKRLRKRCWSPWGQPRPFTRP